jgi:SAM-dependent methyltransferase
MGMNSYRRLCTEFYDLDKPAPPPEALDFYREYARQARGRIIEPMCGSGRFLLPLLAEGYAVEGVDASPDMIRACRANGARRGLQPIVYEQFLEKLDLPHRYGLVFIPAGSFCLLTDPPAARAALARLLAHMEPDARLVVEVERLVPFTPEPWRGGWVERPDDGARIVISQLTRYDEARRVLESVHKYELVHNGQLLETEWEELNVRLYEPAEFGTLLADNGFMDIRHLYEAGPTVADNDAMLFQCRRPSGGFE